MKPIQRYGMRGLALLVSALLFGPAILAAQTPPRSSQAIDLDRELRGKEPQDRARSYYHYSLSKWYEDKGDIIEAIEQMRRALRYNEESASIRVHLAGLLEKSGNMREAISLAQEAARLDPKDPEPHWVLANVYFRSQGRDRANARESLRKAVQELEIVRELDPEDARAHYALGGAYLELGEPDKAVRAYEKFQALVPDVDVGYVALAKHYERAGDSEKAVEYLVKAMQAKPDSAETLLSLANLYAKLNRAEKAIPLYRKIVDLTGGNPAVQRQLAVMLLEAGESQDALDILEELDQAKPGDRDLQVLLGRAQLGSGQFKRAIETFESLLKDDPGNVEAEFYLASAHERGGEPQEAARLFSGLIERMDSASEEQKVNRLVFQQHLASTYIDMGEYEKAIAVYEEMVRNDSNPRFLFLLVNAYRINRQFDKAVALGKSYHEQNPADINLGLVYGRALADAGKTREGADLLLKLLKANPDNVDIYVNLSQVYVQGKRFSDAEKILRQAENRSLGGERVKFQLATVYERQKDFDRAELLFKEILEENPRNATALNYIGYMLADRGVRLQEAVRYVEEALALDPNNGAYLDSLGWAFFKLDELEKAEEYLLKAIQFVKNDPVVLDHLGDLYFRTGDLDRAQEYWRRSIQNGTEQEEVQKVRSKMEKLQDMLRRQKKRQP